MADVPIHYKPAFRLYGEIDGVLRSFPLMTRVVRLGSHRENDLVLPVSGVSRSHAVLITDGHGVTVEDRGSKNGTLVNGARSPRARLVLGDELTVGCVTLHLEKITEGDEQLAVLFDSPSTFEPAFGDSGETDYLRISSRAQSSRTQSSRTQATSQLQWIETFVNLRTDPEVGLAKALETLKDQLGCEAIGVTAWFPNRDQGPVDLSILGAAGDVGDLGQQMNTHRDLLERARKRAVIAGWQLEIIGSDDLVAGLFPVVDSAVAAVVISGDFPGRSACGPWLRLLCRLVETFEGLRDPSSEKCIERPRLAFPDGFVVGSSAAAQSLYRELEISCGGDYPILILGETGCGKEMIAKTLHRSSLRSRKPFVAVNCAAIPADLMEAEMFGVVKGAATGVNARPGYFRQAEGGTLFLDEIGEMPPNLQAKLLRVLEYGEMRPVGGASVKMDVRILSATNVDVERRISEGGFRADLYYRLAAAVITIPSLRERRADLPSLIQHFIHRYCEEFGIHLRGLSQKALEALIAYPWPGNVRELQHVLRRIVRAAFPGQVVDSSLLPAGFQSLGNSLSPPAEAIQPEAQQDASNHSHSFDLKERVAVVERKVIREALAHTGGHRVLTAKLLGISRNTLASKMTLYGLSTTQVISEPDSQNP